METSRRFELRPYQRECIEALPQRGAFLVHMATGLGKSLTFSRTPRQGRMLILSHREELVYQPRKYFDCSYGVEQAGNKSNGEEVVSASVQSLVRRLHRFRPDAFDVIITDECFPAGTLVDNKPIETLCDGDEVFSFNHKKQFIEQKKITHVFKRQRRELKRVTLADGTRLNCTKNHPVYVIERGVYVECEKIKPGEHILRMSFLQKRINCINKTSKRFSQKKRLCVLFERMREETHCRNIINNDDNNQQEICFGQDEEKQSNEKSGVSKENDRNAKENRTQTKRTMGKRMRTNCTPTNVNGCITRVYPCCGIPGTNKNAKRIGLPELLQNRHSNSSCKISNRSGRWQSRFPFKKRRGHQERYPLEIVRVDRIESIEQTSKGEYFGDGYVYNLEVEGNNNYFANGILVHNCHHSTSPTYMKIYDHFKPRLHLGFTATPNRHDGVGLEHVYEDIVFERDLEWGIKNGFLSPIRCLRADIDYDLRGVAIRMGDYAPSELEAAMNIEAANKAIADTYQKYAAGQTLIFACSVAHAKAIAKEIPGAVAVVGGEEREETLAAFSSGALKVLVNCMVFTEGTDLPNIETVIIARPTRNISLYTQMVGRGTRLFPGKEQLTLIDCVGSCDEVDICTAPSLIGMDIQHVKEKQKVEGDLFDLPELIKKEVDNPGCWVKNVEYVDLWARSRKYKTHGVNYYRMPDGAMILSKPKFIIPPEDALGRTMWNGKKVPTQRVFDEVFRALRDHHDDTRHLWDLSSVKRWGAYQASDKQKELISRWGIPTEGLTKLDAMQILTRVMCRAGA